MNINEFLNLEELGRTEITISLPTGEKLPVNFWHNFCQKICLLTELEHLSFNSIPFQLNIKEFNQLIVALSSLKKLHTLNFIHNDLRHLNLAQWKNFGLLISSCQRLINLRIAHNELGLIPFDLWGNSIPALSNPSIECLSLEQNGLYLLSKERWDIWAEKYKLNLDILNLKKIDLSGNYFHKCMIQQFEGIGNYLSNFCYLEQLNLNYNDLHLLNLEKWHALKTTLLRISNLVHLELQGNNLFCLDKEHWSYFQCSLNELKITRLNLTNNHYKNWPIVKWHRNLLPLVSNCYYLTDVLLEPSPVTPSLENILQHHETNYFYAIENISSFDEAISYIDNETIHISITSTRFSEHLSHQDILKTYVMLARKLKPFTKITSLSLIDLDMSDEQFSLWLSIYKTPLKKLNISKNPCGEESNPKELLINDILRKNPEIQDLNLSFSKFSSLSIQALSKFLIHNQTLQSLNLSNIANCDDQSVRFLIASLYINKNLKICHVNSSSANWLLVEIIQLLMEIKNENHHDIPEDLEQRIMFYDDHIHQFIENLAISAEYQNEKLVVPMIVDANQKEKYSFKEYVLKLQNQNAPEPKTIIPIEPFDPELKPIPSRLVLPVNDYSFQTWRLTPEQIYEELAHQDQPQLVTYYLLQKLIQKPKKAPVHQNEIIFTQAFNRLNAHQKSLLLIEACLNRQDSLAQFIFNINISTTSEIDALISNLNILYFNEKDFPPYFNQLMQFALQTKNLKLASTLSHLGTTIFYQAKENNPLPLELLKSWPIEQQQVLKLNITNYAARTRNINIIKSCIDNDTTLNKETIINYIDGLKECTYITYIETLELLLQKYSKTNHQFSKNIKEYQIDINLFQLLIKLLLSNDSTIALNTPNKKNILQIIVLLSTFFPEATLIEIIKKNEHLHQFIFNLEPFKENALSMAENMASKGLIPVLYGIMEIEVMNYLKNLDNLRYDFDIKSIDWFINEKMHKKIPAIHFYEILKRSTEFHSQKKMQELLELFEICLRKGFDITGIEMDESKYFRREHRDEVLKSKLPLSFLQIFEFSLTHDSYFYYQALKLIGKHRNKSLDFVCSPYELPSTFLPFILQKRIPIIILSTLWLMKELNNRNENNEMISYYRLFLPFFMIIVAYQNYNESILEFFFPKNKQLFFDTSINDNYYVKKKYIFGLLITSFTTQISIDIYRHLSLYHIICTIPGIIFPVTASENVLIFSSIIANCVSSLLLLIPALPFYFSLQALRYIFNIYNVKYISEFNELFFIQKCLFWFSIVYYPKLSSQIMEFMFIIGFPSIVKSYYQETQSFLLNMVKDASDVIEEQVYPRLGYRP